MFQICQIQTLCEFVGRLPVVDLPRHFCSQYSGEEGRAEDGGSSEEGGGTLEDELVGRTISESVGDFTGLVVSTGRVDLVARGDAVWGASLDRHVIVWRGEDSVSGASGITLGDGGVV